MDYYKILGVSKNATDEEIKKAYRKMAHQYHPDKSGGDEKKFKEVNAAYQVLSNKEKRAQYDRFGRVFEGAQTGNSQWQGGFDFSGASFGGGFGGDFSDVDFGDLGSVFETVFGGRAGGGRRRTYQRGADIEIGVSITLEEAFRGVTKSLTYETLVECAVCKGRGAEPGSAMKNCNQCDGKGEVQETKRAFFGNFSQVSTCPKCSGEGMMPEKSCKHCSGLGRLRAARQVELHVQSGVDEGQLIKVSGMGEAGVRGTQAGDLYARVHVVSHHVFRRHGDDLLYRTKASLADILLERPIKIPIIEGGSVSLEIPKEFNVKEPLRIRGYGMPRLGRSGRGDTIVELDLVVPKKLSPRAKKLLEDLEKEF